MVRTAIMTATLLLVLMVPPRTAPAAERSAGFDTEHLFSFNIGTDVGTVGDRELEGTVEARSGKRAGWYLALAPTVGYEFVPLPNLRLEVSASLAYRDIAGVTGLDDRRQAAFQAASFEARYRVLDRATSPIGLALKAAPHWGLVDEITGVPVDQYGVDLALLADKELIDNRLVGVFNLIYEPQAARSRQTGEWTREATLGASAGLMVKLQPGVLAGAEIRYLRRYDALDLEAFAGHALFLGPTALVTIDPHWWASAALSFQVAGRAADDAGPLDLVHFERLQARFRLGYTF
jgi:hypothetical protein